MQGGWSQLPQGNPQGSPQGQPGQQTRPNITGVPVQGNPQNNAMQNMQMGQRPLQGPQQANNLMGMNPRSQQAGQLFDFNRISEMPSKYPRE